MSTGIKLELGRIITLLNLINNPHTRFSVIHIAGTNGKGSVSAYIDHILLKAGFKTGRFNSPHLLEPRDSIRINGIPTGNEDFRELLKFISTRNTVNASSFELLTASAFWWFAKQNIEIAVVEVGLGGRLDATNVFNSPPPLVSVITSIGMDHAELLGNSIQEIAREKIGIVKKGGHVVIAPQNEVGAIDTLNRCIAEMECSRVTWVKPAKWDKLRSSGWATLCLDDNQKYNRKLFQLSRDVSASAEPSLNFFVPLKGDIQLENVATAIAAIDQLRKLEQGAFKRISNGHIIDGIASTQWPGRLQYVDISHLVSNRKRRILVDGAHNLPAAISLRNFVDQELDKTKQRHAHFIFASKKGKDVAAIMKALVRNGDTILPLKFSEVDGMPWVHSCDPSEISAYAVKSGILEIKAVDNLNHALQSALELQEQRGGLIVLCGSLYLVADLLRLVQTAS
ncbi:hypothetical protein G9A89_002481 [Geosiphon pyriformis]|nr:hypothetical protein G9A89_002481 [Geosiphon pyriformis]